MHNDNIKTFNDTWRYLELEAGRPLQTTIEPLSPTLGNVSQEKQKCGRQGK